MKKLDAGDLKSCRMQGDFFASSVELAQCGSAIFVRRYMNSKLARMIDRSDLLTATMSPEQMVAELDTQYGQSSYGHEKYGSEILYWMGYVYRYWCIAASKASREVYTICPAREMSLLYYPYHSLDPAQTVSRICEAKGVRVDAAGHSDGYIEEGVAALRRMRSRGGYEYYVVSF